MFSEHYLKIYVKINLILLPLKSEQFMNNLYLQIYIILSIIILLTIMII